MSINDNIKSLDNIKHGFKTIFQANWIKCRSEVITTQLKINNLDYLIDPTFRNIIRLFVLSFKNVNEDLTRDSFHKYYMLLVEIKNLCLKLYRAIDKVLQLLKQQKTILNFSLDSLIIIE